MVRETPAAVRSASTVGFLDIIRDVALRVLDGFQIDFKFQCFEPMSKY